MSELINESPNKRKGLGRGLGSLLGSAEEASKPKTDASSTQQVGPQPSGSANNSAKATAHPQVLKSSEPPTSAGDKIWTVSIEKLKSGQYQPRKTFEKEPLEELSRSIREHGILQPIVVRNNTAGQLEIVAGERRWRAAQLAGLHEVPVIIKNFSNQKTLELSLIENLQRQDLNPIEEAEGYQKLITEFGLTQEQVSERVGKERVTVTNSLRLLKLIPEVRELVQQGQIGSGHAKVLLGVSDPLLQKKLANQVVQQQISVRKLEAVIKQTTKAPEPNSSKMAEANITERLIAGLSEEMQKTLGTKVTIDYNNSRGKMSIYFYSDDELTEIVEKIRDGANN